MLFWRLQGRGAGTTAEMRAFYADHRENGLANGGIAAVESVPEGGWRFLRQGVGGVRLFG